MDGRCGTCKHWIKDPGDEGFDWATCTRLSEDDNKYEQEYIFGSGGEYPISTRSGFGCILWQDKNNTGESMMPEIVNQPDNVLWTRASYRCDNCRATVRFSLEDISQIVLHWTCPHGRDSCYVDGIEATCPYCKQERYFS